MSDDPRVPNLSDLAQLPRWAKVLFLSRCSARVIPLIRRQWPELSTADWQQLAMAGANADASSRLGREVLVGADPLPRILELIQESERQGNLAGFGLSLCASAEKATAFLAQAMERMVVTYAASELNEGAVVGSVWFDYTALRDAAMTNGWTDETSIQNGDLFGQLWPHGTPPGWPVQ
jgi:hypothetical protein